MSESYSDVALRDFSGQQLQLALLGGHRCVAPTHADMLSGRRKQMRTASGYLRVFDTASDVEAHKVKKLLLHLLCVKEKRLCKGEAVV
jgi:hypothetical protein